MWPARVSTDVSSGVQSAATRLATLARRVNSLTPIEQTDSIIAESAAIRLELRKLERKARCQHRQHNEERRVAAKAAAKYARAESQAAAERDAAILSARATIQEAA